MTSTSNSFETLAQHDLNDFENPSHSEEAPMLTSQFIPTSSKKPQKPKQSIDLITSSPNLTLEGKSQGMDIDNVQPETTAVTEIVEERSEA